MLPKVCNPLLGYNNKCIFIQLRSMLRLPIIALIICLLWMLMDAQFNQSQRKTLSEVVTKQTLAPHIMHNLMII